VLLRHAKILSGLTFDRCKKLFVKKGKVFHRRGVGVVDLKFRVTVTFYWTKCCLLRSVIFFVTCLFLLSVFLSFFLSLFYLVFFVVFLNVLLVFRAFVCAFIC
jgi:hypothetical protein